MHSTKQISLMLGQAYTSILLSKKVDSGLSMHGLSFTEFIIIHNLYTSPTGEMSRIALADSVGLSASGVTRLLAPMTKNNITLKTINPRDARQSMVALTETGKTLYADALVTFEHSCDNAFSFLEADEVDQLLGLLNKIKC